MTPFPPSILLTFHRTSFWVQLIKYKRKFPERGVSFPVLTSNLLWLALEAHQFFYVVCDDDKELLWVYAQGELKKILKTGIKQEQTTITFNRPQANYSKSQIISQVSSVTKIPPHHLDQGTLNEYLKDAISAVKEEEE